MANKVKVEFEADSRNFQRGIEKVNQGLDSVKARAMKVKSAITAVLTLGAASGAANTAERIVRASEATGIDPVQIQAIQRTLRLDDVDSVVDVLKELQSKQAETLQLGSTTPTEGFGLVGLGPLDLVGKSTTELFDMVRKGGAKLPLATQRLLLDELSIAGDRERGLFLAAFNDPTYDERFRQNINNAISPDQLLGASDAQRKGMKLLGDFMNLFPKAVGMAANAVEEFRMSPEEAADARAQRTSRVGILFGETPPENQAFTRPEDFQRFIDGQPNVEIKRLMERQLEELQEMNRKANLYGFTSDHN